MSKRKGRVHRGFSDLSSDLSGVAQAKSEALQGRRMEGGFTLVELLVVIAIIALLMAILMPALARAREMGKRAVCQSQIKQLAVGWYMYCDDSKEKVPVGDVWYSWTFPTGASGGPQLAWCEWPHRLHPGVTPGSSTTPTYATNYTGQYSYAEAPGLSDEIWKHAIAEGTMWKYVKDHKVYKCPVGDKGHRVTNFMSHSMNTWPGSAGPGSLRTGRNIKLRGDIRRTAERFVFLDVGGFKQGAFFLNYDGGGGAPPGSFGDHRPTRHGRGTDFVFADQHVEYRKWIFATATATVETGGWGGTSQPCDCDWRWFCKITWGDVPLNCTTPGKKCEY